MLHKTIIISLFCWNNTGYTFSSTKSEYKTVTELVFECGNYWIGIFQLDNLAFSLADLHFLLLSHSPSLIISSLLSSSSLSLIFHSPTTSLLLQGSGDRSPGLWIPELRLPFNRILTFPDSFRFPTMSNAYKVVSRTHQVKPHSLTTPMAPCNKRKQCQHTMLTLPVMSAMQGW